VRTKTAIIDKDLQCFELFDFYHGEDEMDVVGTFKQSKPQVIFETGNGGETMSWVPFDGVAFICEIKSNLTASGLESDLEKLSKLRKLDASSDRFKHKKEGDFDVEEPLRCLIYDNETISEDTLHDYLHEFIEDWHMLLIIENDVLLINTSLIPYTNFFMPSSDYFIHADMLDGASTLFEEYAKEAAEVPDSELLSFYDGIFHFIMCLSYSTPDPQVVYTVRVLDNLRPEPYRTNFRAKTDFEDSPPTL
jgi:hypothetical protein